ncbi:5'-3' exonuclease [Nosocomiicoccus sp. HMSC059G07]|uniref:5'-3' exonuclease n=1 Tax=Nosocomiicoccus sp. HMSC059G07 TaxID=1739531 RepID=UPI0008A6139C|nr:5'-3' exonuclease [Nosocomiicoccus sp. HMSC059G07]OFO55420.1 5'-3' exonuclease [Nosocomiicoccus sp. HMSC059G07]
MLSKLLIVDGMALLFRHFFATNFSKQFFYNSLDLPTNGVQGTIRHIYKAIEIIQPEKVIITWDMGSETVRTEWYENYKSNRPAPPEELVPQFDLVKDVLAELDFYQVGLKGYEADDLIGTITKHYDDSVIISGDKDLLQVINDDNELWLTKKGYTEYEIYDLNRFTEEFSITPEQFIDVKALMGDSGDGYFGVTGIGEKTALKLIQKHQSLDHLLENLDTLTKRQKENILKDYDHLILSRRLAEIITDVPINVNDVIQYSDYTFNLDRTLQVLDKYDLTIAKRYVEGLDL